MFTDLPLVVAKYSFYKMQKLDFKAKLVGSFILIKIKFGTPAQSEDHQKVNNSRIGMRTRCMWEPCDTRAY